MKITALSSQSFVNQSAKNTKVSAQSPKAQQYFADSVSFSGKLPTLSAAAKMRTGIAALAATLLAGGFAAGSTITSKASEKEQTAIVVEQKTPDNYNDNEIRLLSAKKTTESAKSAKASKMSKAEKKEIKKQIKSIENKILANNAKIDKINDTLDKIEFLQFAKTKSGYAYTSQIDGEVTKNPYADYFNYIQTTKNDPYCKGCSDYFFEEQMRQLEENLPIDERTGETPEEYLKELEEKKAALIQKHEEEKAAHEQRRAEIAQKTEEMEKAADEKADEMRLGAYFELAQLLNTTTIPDYGSGQSEKANEKIKQLEKANEKLNNKLEKLYNKIMEPKPPVIGSPTGVIYSEYEATMPFIRPTEGPYVPSHESWEYVSGPIEPTGGNCDIAPASNTGIPTAPPNGIEQIEVCDDCGSMHN